MSHFLCSGIESRVCISASCIFRTPNFRASFSFKSLFGPQAGGQSICGDMERGCPATHTMVDCTACGPPVSHRLELRMSELSSLPVVMLEYAAYTVIFVAPENYFTFETTKASEKIKKNTVLA